MSAGVEVSNDSLLRSVGSIRSSLILNLHRSENASSAQMVSPNAQTSNNDSDMNFESDPKSSVFRNLSIMEMIFDWLLEDYEPTIKERKYLLNSALTSKDFFYPGINLLWRTLDSNGLMPILQLIPTFDIIVENGEIPYDCTETPITEGDLVKLNQYCSRVRRLYLSVADPEGQQFMVAGHVYFKLQDLQKSVLFPSLKKLRISREYFRADEDLVSLSLIPSPTITCVEMHLDLDQMTDIRIRMFLDQLLELNAPLSDLNIKGAISFEILDIARQFKSLKTLSLHTYKPWPNGHNILNTIFQASNLQYLRLTLYAIALPNTNSFNAPFPRLPDLLKLQEFMLVTSQVHTTSDILRITVKHMPFLTSLILVTASDRDTSASFESCVGQAVASFPQLTMFKCYNIQMMPWRALEKTCDWKKLTQLSIDAPVLLLDDGESINDIRWIFNSPQQCLKKVSLQIEAVKAGDSTVRDINTLGFSILEGIASYHPNVAELSLYMPLGFLNQIVLEQKLELCRGDRRVTLTKPYASEHNLRSLVFLPNRVPITSPQPRMYIGMLLADYLNVLFPKLEVVDFSGVRKTHGEDWCDSVSAMVRCQ